MSFAPHRELAEAAERADHYRRPLRRPGGAPGHKEWHHFCVYGDGIDALVNFSIVDDVRPGVKPGTELARLVVILKDEHWEGGVELFEMNDVDVEAGRVNARFGANTMRLEDGVYRLTVTMTERPVRLELELRVLSFPAPAYNVEVGDGPPIHWLVIPRLSANGTIEVDGRVHRLRDAPAYHDHNWGWFRWGRDFAWEWGFGIPPAPDDPWSVVFVRLSDRGHTRAMMQALFVWKHSRLVRVFRASDVALERVGHLRQRRVFKLPRPMGLLSPGRITDVPQRVEIRGEADGDWGEASFDAEDGSQVIIPNDDDLGVTIINEVAARFRARGRVGGEQFETGGRSIFEYLGA